MLKFTKRNIHGHILTMNNYIDIGIKIFVPYKVLNVQIDNNIKCEYEKAYILK